MKAWLRRSACRCQSSRQCRRPAGLGPDLMKAWPLRSVCRCHEHDSCAYRKESVMNTKRIHGWIGGAGLSLVLLWALPVSAQTFNSGSNGSLGAFTPPTGTTTVTLPADGVLNYTTITIPS